MKKSLVVLIFCFVVLISANSVFGAPVTAEEAGAVPGVCKSHNWLSPKVTPYCDPSGIPGDEPEDRMGGCCGNMEGEVPIGDYSTMCYEPSQGFYCPAGSMDSPIFCSVDPEHPEWDSRNSFDTWDPENGMTSKGCCNPSWAEALYILQEDGWTVVGESCTADFPFYDSLNRINEEGVSVRNREGGCVECVEREGEMRFSDRCVDEGKDACCGGLCYDSDEGICCGDDSFGYVVCPSVTEYGLPGICFVDDFGVGVSEWGCGEAYVLTNSEEQGAVVEPSFELNEKEFGNESETWVVARTGGDVDDSRTCFMVEPYEQTAYCPDEVKMTEEIKMLSDEWVDIIFDKLDPSLFFPGPIEDYEDPYFDSEPACGVPGVEVEVGINGARTSHFTADACECWGVEGVPKSIKMELKYGDFWGDIVLRKFQGSGEESEGAAYFGHYHPFEPVGGSIIPVSYTHLTLPTN